MNTEFIEALEELEKDRGISIEVLLDALEAALISAYKRNFGSAQNVRVSIDRETGEIKVFARKNVVDAVEDDRLEISLTNAKNRDPRYELEDIVEIEVTPKDFGRIAAQTAKQVVVQRIREAERGIIFEEFSNREGDIVTGIVQRQDQKNVYVDLGKTEAILAPTEQINGEEYRHSDRIKTYIVEVKKTTKGPQVLVSRTHPGLLKRLFELEVPEIHDGVVELKSVAREAGARSKIAVYSKDENVDPVGACVGPKGMRVQTIVTELKGEKIDIVKWNQDPAKYVANALSPAKVVNVKINEQDKIARVVVPDYQLSLAIGKEGQNARLAAKLTGWKIDIKSESQIASMGEELGGFDDNEDAVPLLDEYFEEDYEGEYVEGDYSEYEYEEGYDENYEGDYSEDYEGDYTADDQAGYDEDYQGDYDPAYDANYEENYEGDFEGEYDTDYGEPYAEDANAELPNEAGDDGETGSAGELAEADQDKAAADPEAKPKKGKAKKAKAEKTGTEAGEPVAEAAETKKAKGRKTAKNPGAAEAADSALTETEAEEEKPKKRKSSKKKA